MNLSIDVIATSDQPLVLKLSLANLMSKPLPGVFQTKGPPGWGVDRPDLVTMTVQDNGNTCLLVSDQPDQIVQVTLTCSAWVDENMDGNYVFDVAEANVTIGPATKVAGFVMVPSSPNALVK